MSVQGKRALVTGSSGFVAANLIPALLAQGAEVHGIVRPGSQSWRLREWLATEGSNMHIHEVDLVQTEAVDHIMRTVRPDFIFHLAVQRKSATRQERAETLYVNVIGTWNMLESAAEIGCERFIYTGSSLEYGPKPAPSHESDLLKPSSYFGATKAAASTLCQQAALAGRCPVVLLRLYSVYGPWEAPHRLIPTALMAALGDGHISLTEPGYRRDLIFVEDVVEACLQAAQIDRAVGEIINIGSGQQWANEEIVTMIEAITGRKLNVRMGTYPPRQTDTSFWVADISKSRDLLNWEPRHTLEKGLCKMLDWLIPRQTIYAELMNTAQVRA
ncbi:MAG: NAD(P)-dependent oxidoreductase [Anaerolineae bacterium]|nr:NAD(P)-dependent oxidoreductase [Thermoflexales bacterium]MDW8407256.1 NAD(P)-dependent oxidoreductase [Anaerolineae bacterium]